MLFVLQLNHLSYIVVLYVNVSVLGSNMGSELHSRLFHAAWTDVLCMLQFCAIDF